MTNLAELAARRPDLAVASAEINRDTIAAMQAEHTRLVSELKKRDDTNAELKRQVGIIRERLDAQEEAIEEIEVVKLTAILKAIGDDNLVFVDFDGIALDATALVTEGERTTRLALEFHRFLRGKPTGLRKRCAVCRKVACPGCGDAEFIAGGMDL